MRVEHAYAMGERERESELGQMARILTPREYELVRKQRESFLGVLSRECLENVLERGKK